MTKRTTIYSCFHKPGYMLEGDSFKSLHVGKNGRPDDIGCPGDDTGDNISFKNPFYCELTAQYWMWKNDVDSDFIGLMHYRRHFNFSSQTFTEDQWGTVVAQRVDEKYQEKFGLTDILVQQSTEANDVILPKKWDVRQAGSRNNYDHYDKSADLFIEDYQAAINILLSKHPEYYQDVQAFNESPYGYYTNMFVLKKEIFNAYSAWLFSILDELEYKVSLDRYNVQQSRVFGHIAERLLSIYFAHYERMGGKIRECQRVFAHEIPFNGQLEPRFEKNDCPIIICFDDNYSHSAGALVSSIMAHSSSQNNYDVIVLGDNISDKNKHRFVELVSHLPNFSIRFFDVNAFDEIRSVHTRAHFSAATYARLFIPRILLKQTRALFIDADTVVNSDVAELFDEELGGALVGAVRDIVMEGFVKFGAISDSHTGAMEAGKYLSRYLGMKRPADYFQAGLIIFDLQKMRAENTYDKFMKLLKEKDYWFLDQDILNKAFDERVHFLPMRWNVLHGNGNTNDFFPNLVFSTYSEFLEARLNPCMVHYAGDQKPWNNLNVDFAELYWKHLRSTPWYEERASFSPHHSSSNVSVSENISVGIEERFRRKIKPMVNKWFPYGSQRRMWAAKSYFKTLYGYRKVKFALFARHK